MSSSAAQKYRGLSLVAAATVLAACAQAPAVGPRPAAGTEAPQAAAPAQPAQPALAGGTVITAAATDEVEGGQRGVARSRTVTVDTAVLPADAGAEDLELPLFDDTTVVVDLAAPEFRSEGGYRTWSGTIDGDEGSTVVLVEQGGVLSGLVTSKDATYRLRPLPDGTTRVEQVDESQFPTTYAHAVPPADGGFDVDVTTDDGHSHAPGTPEHSHAPDAAGEEHPHSHAPGTPEHSHAPDAGGEEHPHSHAPGTPEHSHDVPPSAPAEGEGTAAEDVPPTSAATPDAPVVDVLVAYSTAAETYNGGQAGMDAEIALMIEQTNTAFGNSGINAVLRLAHTAEVALNGLVDGNTLGRLANPSDGVYDELHILRDQYGADLVALITTSPSGPYCGIAYQMTSISTSFAPYAMSVTDAGCATGNTTFTHELGHNFGAAHDRGPWSGTPVLPYGYDWVNPQQGWRTVMAYANACGHCGKILRFSNPDQTYNGAPLGAPAGAANAADNRAVLNTTSSTVASMRGAPAPASLTLTSPAAGAAVVASGKLVATWSTSGYMGPDAKVELLRGGAVVKLLTAKTPLGTGRHESVVPLSTARGDDYAVRVTPLLAPQYAQTGDAFSIVDPSITPTLSGSAVPGGTVRVAWTYTGVPGGGVKVELLKDDKALAVLKSSAVLGAGGAGAVDVVLPAALNDGAGYRIRTTLTTVAKAPALTADFSVASTRRLVVTAPAAGAGHTAGTPLTVTWTASGVLGASVKAELVKGGVVVSTSPVAPATRGTLTFTPPAKLPGGDDYRVRLVAVSYPTVQASSAGTFSVAGTSLTVTSQGTASTVTAGQRLPISWTTVGVPGTAVKLEAVSPGRPAVVATAGAPLAGGTYSWAVPVNLPRGDWQIRATVVGNVLVTSTSAAATTVSWPTVSASASPSGVAGGTVTVSWTLSDGAVAPVRVRLVQGTKVFATVTSNGVTATGGTGSVVHRLPVNLAPGTFTYDVTAAANAALTAATGSVSVTRPTLAVGGATSVARGATATISWSFSDGAVAPVKIELVQGTRIVVVRSGAVTASNGTGSFAYKAPATLAPGSYTVRVRPALLATSTAIQATGPFTVT